LQTLSHNVVLPEWDSNLQRRLLLFFNIYLTSIQLHFESAEVIPVSMVILFCQLCVFVFSLDSEGMKLSQWIKQNTFNNVSVISWFSISGVPGEKHLLLVSFSYKLYHIMLYCPSGIRTYKVSGDRYWLHR
jgi:hypothetical protein